MEFLTEFPEMGRQDLRDFKKFVDASFKEFSRTYGDALENFFEPLLWFLVWLEKLLINAWWPVVILVLAGLAWLGSRSWTVSYTHLRAHETSLHLVCRLLLEKKNNETSLHLVCRLLPFPYGVVGCFFFLMIRRPPRSTQGVSSAASDVYKRQGQLSSLKIFSKKLMKLLMIQKYKNLTLLHKLHDYRH